MQHLFDEIGEIDSVGKKRLLILMNHSYEYKEFFKSHYAHILLELYVVSKEIDFDDFRYLVKYYYYNNGADKPLGVDEKFIFKAIEFRKKRGKNHNVVDSDDLEYLNNLSDEMYGIQEAAEIKVKSSEIKDEIQQLEEEKNIQKKIIESMNTSLGVFSSNMAQNSKNEAASLARQKEDLNNYIIKTIKKANKKKKKNVELYENLKDAIHISTFVPKYGFKALAFPTKIILGVMIISGIFVVAIISFSVLLGIFALIILALINSLFMMISIKKDRIKYYDAKWLSELRNEYLKKIEPKEKKLIANLSQVKEYLEVIDECEAKISDIDEKLEQTLSNYNYYDEKYNELMQNVEFSHLKCEIIGGQFEGITNKDCDLFDLLGNEKEGGKKTLKKTIFSK